MIRRCHPARGFFAAKDRCNLTPLTEFMVLRVAQGDKAVEAARAQIEVNA